MLKETIYLYHTPIEEAIEYMISQYGFKPDQNHEGTFISTFKAIVPIPSITELGTSNLIKLTIEKEGEFQKLVFTASYHDLNMVFGIMVFLTVVLTLLIFSWPYILLFILMPLIVYVSGRLKFQAYFLSFCEKLKNEIVNPQRTNMWLTIPQEIAKFAVNFSAHLRNQQIIRKNKEV